jgi:hypothetical protein
MTEVMRLPNLDDDPANRRWLKKPLKVWRKMRPQQKPVEDERAKPAAAKPAENVPAE